jgi:parallel beta-helix repeat protein
LSIILVLLLVDVMALVFPAKPVKASSMSIFIRADGSVEPLTASLFSVDNVTYVFTSNIYGSIVIERNNIVVDGAGYSLRGQGTVDFAGINLTQSSNVTLRNMNVVSFYSAFSLYSSSNISLNRNNVENNSYGFYLLNCSSVNINENNLTQNSDYDVMLSDSSYNEILSNRAMSPNEACIFLDGSSRNNVSGNDLTSYGVSVRLWFSSDNNTITNDNLRGEAFGIECQSSSSSNIIYHNNFVGNANYVSTSNCVNIWDGGYPTGGNYWSNNTGVDVKSGPYQNETGSDGISDSAYAIDANNIDHYPLMEQVAVTIQEFPSISALFLLFMVALLAATNYRRKRL